VFRVGLIRANGAPEAQNFNTKEEADEFLLILMDKEKLRQARLKDLTTGIEEIII
jgi:3'-phosphoadenosine 5'-phosphosulfate sulfotransferase